MLPPEPEASLVKQHYTVWFLGKPYARWKLKLPGYIKSFVEGKTQLPIGKRQALWTNKAISTN
ncbi:MAG: hypothetical protein KAW41_02250 [Candidatus Diapherotrites archaeon]|nr:hypothetical protein [Candidatus Diapherotrites archaeon]